MEKSKLTKKKKIIIASSVLSALALTGLGVGLSFIPRKQKTILPVPGRNGIPSNDKIIPPLPEPIPVPPVLPGEKTEEEQQLSQQKNQSSNLIRKYERVKYLALGDSISAGFSGELPKDYPGELKDGKVVGISFPAYLAHFINQISKDKLQSFDNFAVSGSTIVDWIDLLQVEYSKNEIEQKHYELSQTNGLKQKFNDLEKTRTEIINKIKESNLITITLGANDVIKILSTLALELDLTKIIDEFIEKGSISQQTLISDLLPNVTKILTTIRSLLQSRLVALSNHIKKINPKANVILASYPLPMQRLLLMVNEVLPPKVQSIISIDKLFSKLLTEKIKESAKKTNINFVNVYDFEFWNEFQEKLTPMALDIHPSFYGYKKMAMELFLKISSGTKFTYDVAKKYGITKKHFNDLTLDVSDQNEWIIELPSQNVDSIYSKIFTNDFEKFLFQDDELINQFKDQIDAKNFGKRITEEGAFSIFATFKNAIFTIFKNPKYLEIDPQRHLANFFEKENGKNIILLEKWFSNSKFFIDAINKIQSNITTKDWDGDGKPGVKKLKIEYLKLIFAEVFDQNQIFKLVKELLTSDFATTNSDDLTKTITNFFVSLSQNPKIESLIKGCIQKALPESVEKYISKKDLQVLVVKLFKSKHLPKIVEKFVNGIFTLKSNHPEKFESANTFEDLTKILFAKENNFTDLINTLNSLVMELIKDQEVKEILIKTTYSIIEKQYPSFLKNTNEEELKKVILGLINSSTTILENIQVLPIVFQEIFSEVASNGFNFNIGNLVKNSSEKIGEHFKKLDYGKLILHTGKIIANNQELQQNIVTFKTFATNISNYVLEKFKVKKEFESILKVKASSFFDNEQIKLLSNILIKEENIQMFFDYVLDLTINKKEIYNESKTANELFDKLFDNSSSNNLNNFATKFVNKIFDYPETSQLINSLSSKYGLNKDIAQEQFTSMIKSMLDFVLKQDKELSISTDLVKTIFTSLLSSNFSGFDVELILKSFTSKLNEMIAPNNLIKLIKSILTNDKLRQNAANIEKFLNNLTLFVVNKPELKSTVASNISSLSYTSVADYLSQEEYTKIIEFLLGDQDLHSILSKSIKNMLSLNKDKVNGINTFNDLVKVIFEDSQITSDLNAFVTKFINKLIKEPKVQNIIGDILYNVAKKHSNIVDNIEQEKFNSLVVALLDKIETLDQNHQLIAAICKIVFEQFKTKGIEFKLDHINTQVLEVLKQKFGSPEQLEKFTLEVFKLFANEPIFKKEANVIKVLVSNIFAFTSEKLVLKQKAEEAIVPYLKTFMEEQSAKKLVEILFKPEISQEIFSYVIDVIFTRGSEYVSATSVKELLSKIFKDPQNDLGLLVSKLLDKISSYPETQTILKEILHKNNLDTDLNDDDIKKLTNNLLAVIFEYDKKEKIINSFVEKLLVSLIDQGLGFNIKDELAKIIQQLKLRFNDEQKAVDFVKFLITNKNIKEISTPLQKLILNVYNKITTEESTKKKIIEIVSHALAKLLETQDQEETIKKVSTFVFENEQIKKFFLKIIDLSINTFTTEELKDVNNYSDLLKVIFSKETIKTSLTSEIKTTFDAFIKNEDCKKIFAKVIVKVVDKKYNEIFQGIEKDKIEEIVLSLFEFLPIIENKLEAIQLLSESLYDNLGKNGTKFNIEEFMTSLSSKLKTKIENKELMVSLATEIIKLIPQSQKLKENQESIKKLLVNILKFTNKELKLNETIISKIKEAPIAQEYLGQENVDTLINSILQDKNYEAIVDFAIKAIIENAQHYQNLNTVDEIIDKLFEHNNIYELIEKLIKNTFENNQIDSTITSIFKKLELTNNIEEAKVPELAKNIVLGFVELDKDTDFNYLSKLLKTLFKGLVAKGKDFKVEQELEEFTKELKTKFTDTVQIVKLLKVLASKPTIKNSVEQIPTLIKNLIIFVSKKMKLSELTYNKIPEKISKYLDKETYTKIFDKIIQEPNIYALVEPSIKDMITNNHNYVSVKDFKDIFKVFIEKNESTYKLDEKIKTLLTSIANYEETQNLFASYLTNLANDYGFDFRDEANQKFFKDLAKNIPNVLDKLGLITNIVNFVKTNVDLLSEPIDFFDKLKDSIVSLIDFKDPKILISIFGMNFMKQHKDTITNDINKMITTFAQSPETVDKILEKSKIDEKYKNFPNGKQEFANLLKTILKSEDLKQILLSFANQLIEKNSDYSSFTLWSQVIHKFLNTTDALKIKDAMKKLIPEALNNSKFISMFLGETMGNSLVLKGYNEDAVNRVRPYMSRFLDSFFKGVVKTDILGIIIDGIFENVKNLRPDEKIIEHYLQDVKTVAIKGAIKFISNGDDTILVTKVMDELEKNDRSKTVFENVDPEAFAHFINFFFRHSKLTGDDKSLYGSLFADNYKNELKKHPELVKQIEEKTIFPDFDDSFVISGMRSKTTETLNIKVDPGSILQLLFNYRKLLGKLKNIISHIFRPLAKEYWKQVSYNRFVSIESAKRAYSYKAAQRLYSGIMAAIISNTVDKALFPTKTMVNTIEEGVTQAFRDEFLTNQEYRSNIMNKYKDKSKLRYIYLTENYEVKDWHLSGMIESYSRYNKLYDSSYKNSKYRSIHKSDWIIYYQYYYNGQDSMIDVPNIIQIAKALKYGKI